MSLAIPHPGPGRPREFDLDDAVRDALEVFRQRGYHGASMVDLLEGTKLSRGSLYKAFPDKRSLFFAAFDLYAREALERLREKLATGNGREGIRTALLHYAHISAQACWQKGCLISTATGELLPEDDDARRRVEDYYAQDARPAGRRCPARPGGGRHRPRRRPGGAGALSADGDPGPALRRQDRRRRGRLARRRRRRDAVARGAPALKFFAQIGTERFPIGVSA